MEQFLVNKVLNNSLVWKTRYTWKISPRLLVDDKEVGPITEYLRSTGVREYISSVTQQLEEDNTNLEKWL